MFAIEIELLGGRYAATSHNNRERAEWPPHPARFYSALVAALHDRAPVDTDEREALLWLEGQAAPSLEVDLSVDEHVGRRRVLDTFVPVNDVTLIGDLERGLREAQKAVAAAELLPEGPEKKRNCKEANKRAQRESAALARKLDEHRRPDPNPSKKAIHAAAALLPHQRTRQVRTFPAVIPAESVFVFAWLSAEPIQAQRRALARLCERVTRLGHSSSLVRCAVINRPIEPNLVPNEDGGHMLRTVGPGQLERLEREYGRHQGVESRVLPARAMRYGPPTPAGAAPAPRSAFSDEWIVLERVGGARLLSSAAAALGRALRSALLEQNGSESLPPVLGGHLSDGRPADVPHLAFVTLPFVGHEHADASVQGCAVVPPRDLSAEHRAALLRLFATWERDRALDPLGTMELGGPNLASIKLHRADLPLKTSLRSATWCRPSRRFATATPIALDRNPGDLASRTPARAARAAAEAQESIANACERIGLPRPVAVAIGASPMVQGAQPTRMFSRRSAPKGKPPRVMVHAELVFDVPVRGPILLGAGRYFGLGLCMPIGGGG